MKKNIYETKRYNNKNIENKNISTIINPSVILNILNNNDILLDNNKFSMYNQLKKSDSKSRTE